MRPMQRALETISIEIEKALFKRYDQRRPHLDAAFKAYVEAIREEVKDRKAFKKEHSDADLLASSISQALEHPAVEASSYALNGLRHVTLRVKERFEDLTKEQADELWEHLDTCGFMYWGIGGLDRKLAEYDSDVPAGYVDGELAKYRAERDAHYEDFKKRHPDWFKEEGEEYT